MLTFFIRRPRFCDGDCAAADLYRRGSTELIPVEQYPQITPPVVNVNASWPGAPARRTSRRAIAAPPDSSTALTICCIWSLYQFR